MGLFFFTQLPRGNSEVATADHELARGIGLKVEIPTWVLRPTTLRCDDDEVVSIGEIQKGHRSRATGFAALGCQQADGCAIGEAAQPFAAAQAVEHYEISRYGTLKAWAEQLGLDDAAELLQETLDEEEATDEALTEIAKSAINQQAEAA